MINGIYNIKSEKGLGNHYRVVTGLCRQSSEYPNVDKKKGKKNLPTNLWYYKENFANSVENTVTLLKKQTPEASVLSHKSLLLFVLNGSWDTTVSYNFPHQVQ